MADNTLLNIGTGGDTIRVLARAAGTVKTQVFQLDLGGATANAEVLITAGQQVMAASVPVAIASNQSALPVSIASMPSTPVTGTFWPVTQPVSIATAPVLVAGTAIIGKVGIDQTTPGATNLVSIGTNGSVSGPAITKGTQGTTGFAVQDLKDSGRNQTNYFTATAVLTTAAEVMQSLTGYKGGVAVTATATPAVVTAGKTLRINRITITYIAIATAGSALVTLRCNLAGVAIVGSPLVDSWIVGGPSAVAGATQTTVINSPDGMEFAAASGIAVGVTGLGATGTATIVGYCKVSVGGYEY